MYIYFEFFLPTFVLNKIHKKWSFVPYLLFLSVVNQLPSSILPWILYWIPNWIVYRFSTQGFHGITKSSVLWE